MTPQLEVIVLSLDEAKVAQAGGAHSLEIVADMAVGGLTPALDTVRAIRDRSPLTLNVMVRPHARSFSYSPDEIEIILRDAELFSAVGANSIVFGVLRPDDTVDLDLVRAVATAAHPAGLTLHRALDQSVDAESALESLRGVISRVLTSGMAETVWEGRETLRQWTQQFGGSISIACGGGVTLGTLVEAARFIGAPEFHVGNAARTNGLVDRDKVRALIDALNDQSTPIERDTP